MGRRRGKVALRRRHPIAAIDIEQLPGDVPRSVEAMPRLAPVTSALRPLSEKEGLLLLIGRPLFGVPTRVAP
jgi:hypothetical protein